MTKPKPWVPRRWEKATRAQYTDPNPLDPPRDPCERCWHILVNEGHQRDGNYQQCQKPTEPCRRRCHYCFKVDQACVPVASLGHLTAQLYSTLRDNGRRDVTAFLVQAGRALRQFRVERRSRWDALAMATTLPAPVRSAAPAPVAAPAPATSIDRRLAACARPSTVGRRVAMAPARIVVKPSPGPGSLDGDEGEDEYLAGSDEDDDEEDEEGEEEEKQRRVVLQDAVLRLTALVLPTQPAAER